MTFLPRTLNALPTLLGQSPSPQPSPETLAEPPQPGPEMLAFWTTPVAPPPSTPPADPQEATPQPGPESLAFWATPVAPPQTLPGPADFAKVSEALERIARAVEKNACATEALLALVRQSTGTQENPAPHEAVP